MVTKGKVITAEEGKGTGRRKKGMWEGDKDRGEDVGERIRWKYRTQFYLVLDEGSITYACFNK